MEWEVVPMGENPRWLGGVGGPPDTMYVSEEYVAELRGDSPDLFREPGAMTCVTVYRKNLQPIGDNHWRILQEVKNTLLGPEFEAVELYPAESRKVDMANQYHLWAWRREGRQFLFGFQERRVRE